MESNMTRMSKALGNEPIIPSEDLTSLFIELRNLIGRLPKKGAMVRLHTVETTYTGRIQSVSIPEGRIMLSIEDGVTVVIPFHALMMPANGNGRQH
jgi:hypothetical protein